MKIPFQKTLRPALRHNGKPGERVLMPYPRRPGEPLHFLPDDGATVTASTNREKQYWLAAIHGGDVEVLEGSSDGKPVSKPKPVSTARNFPKMQEEK